jgi:hypothetical protein
LRSAVAYAQVALAAYDVIAVGSSRPAAANVVAVVSPCAT